MQYRLKSNEAPFEVVDGPMAGRKFSAGETYTEVPPQEAHRFEEIGHGQDLESEFAAAGSDNGGE
ncbi:MAG: hypothetical protein A4E64_02138 [Syntrophorhabdus sp. PtaU1.Bin058]|nr:MAG: hypothetical protein A4E64_02138 [Syntrophorhabdus sp. PtaU1.Bin058]